MHHFAVAHSAYTAYLPQVRHQVLGSPPNAYRQFLRSLWYNIYVHWQGDRCQFASACERILGAPREPSIRSLLNAEGIHALERS